MRTATITNDFIGGVFSPRLFGRTDLKQYDHAVDTMENFILWPHGGIASRAGTYYCADVKTHDKKTILVPFIFKNDQAYILEFGHLYMRVYKDYGQVQSGGSAYEIVTTYTEADLPYIKYGQSFDTMYIVTGKHKPRKLTRTSHTNWTITDFAPTADPFTASNKYPRAVYVGFGGRLWFGGTDEKPQTFWASKTNAWDNFTTGSADTDAIEGTIDSNKVSSIRWFELLRDRLVVGTDGGMYGIHSSDKSTSVTTKTITIPRDQAGIGASSVQGIQIGIALLFPQNGGRRVLEEAYVLDDDAYRTPDMTLFAEHLFRSASITAIAWQEKPNRILWCLRSDGVLAGFTYMREQSTTGWHVHKIAGTDAKVESIAVIPNADQTHDDLWLLVSRTVNGGTKRTIEYMKHSDQFTAQEDYYYVDAGLTYDSTPASTISGLGHLEGESVTILADGAVHPNRTVTSGEVTLDYDASVVHVGLAYQAKLKTLKTDAVYSNLTGQTRLKRIDNIVLRVYESIGGKAGPDENTLETIYTRSSAHNMDEPVPTFTGDVLIHFPAGWETDGTITVIQDQPLPLNIICIVMYLNVSEKYGSN